MVCIDQGISSKERLVAQQSPPDAKVNAPTASTAQHSRSARKCETGLRRQSENGECAEQEDRYA